jgi:hypothetical protein
MPFDPTPVLQFFMRESVLGAAIVVMLLIGMVA